MRTSRVSRAFQPMRMVWRADSPTASAGVRKRSVHSFRLFLKGVVTME
jgi:hypothetical protein